LVENGELPTIREAISAWLGVQLPSLPPLPQTLKNLDKAIGKIVLASGENLEARIRSNTGRTKARGKINVEGMFRTEEERRKLENRVAATQAALEDIQANPAAADAQAEIQDDWLNLFARLAEDKSSDDLRRLFGKVLAGEIKKPGSFSLRTIQILATVSKEELAFVSDFLSHAINASIVPFVQGGPTYARQLLMEELGIAGHPAHIGGSAKSINVLPQQHSFATASHRGILVQNLSAKEVSAEISGQALTASARELLPISNSPATDLEFLKTVASQVYSQLRGSLSPDMDAGLISVHIVATTPIDSERYNYQIIYTVPKP
jgi:Protein of unknown function (DUF2806)